MPSGSGVFATLPDNFFSPLARLNREHYAALLILYYRLFQENARGLEREQVIRSFTEYLGQHRNALADEGADDFSPAGESALDGGTETDDETPELDFGRPRPESGASRTTEETTEEIVEDAGETAAIGGKTGDRALANIFLRRLIGTGWLSEETLSDYSRVINITPWGRPFFEALARVEEGLKTEYESHVVAVYSLLCGDAVAENGHYAVLNAHGTTQTLIDSLKVLSQSIKGHYDRLTGDAESSDIRGILHLHYDLYAADILDGAYKRLKTSDNLSRYRPRIIKKVGDLLADEKWLSDSARKLSRNNSLPQEDNKRRLETMLEDIRDTLRAVDPLLEDIDRRNMLYARSSVERVKALLEPDSTLAGKLSLLVKEIYSGKTRDGESGETRLAHRLHRIRTFAPESLYRRYQRETADFSRETSPVDREAMERAEAALLIRLRRQLGVKRIGDWLDSQGGREHLLSARDLIKDEASFIHFVYSVLYADSRPAFGYGIEEAEYAGETAGDTVGASVRAGGYVVPGVTLRRKE
ncbi:MAG: DUF5716 family protein [Spirochaetaceae bacterium]|jgi:hypothetical protein|nr:DUF5716 family protein [Spirochaetaceae bacterium]